MFSVALLKAHLNTLSRKGLTVEQLSKPEAINSRELDEWRKDVLNHYGKGIATQLHLTQFQTVKNGNVLISCRVGDEQLTVALFKKQRPTAFATISEWHSFLQNEDIDYVIPGGRALQIYGLVKPYIHYEYGLVLQLFEASVKPISAPRSFRQIQAAEPRYKRFGENHHRQWGDDDQKLSEFIREDKPIREMAKLLGRSDFAVIERLVHLNFCTAEIGEQIKTKLRTNAP